MSAYFMLNFESLHRSMYSTSDIFVVIYILDKAGSMLTHNAIIGDSLHGYNRWCFASIMFLRDLDDLKVKVEYLSGVLRQSRSFR